SSREGKGLFGIPGRPGAAGRLVLLSSKLARADASNVSKLGRLSSASGLLAAQVGYRMKQRIPPPTPASVPMAALASGTSRATRSAHPCCRPGARLNAATPSALAAARLPQRLNG